jgi:putative heme-binding domain-containing protein
MVLLTKYLQRGEGSPKLRRTALASMLWWSEPPVLDPVEGRYRKHAPRDPAVANKAVAKLRDVILADPDLTEVLLNGVMVRGEAAWLEGAAEHFDGWTAAVQTRYLDALAKVEHDTLRVIVTEGLASEHAQVREKAREHAKKAGIDPVDLLLAVLDDPDPAGQGKAVMQLVDAFPDPRAQARFKILASAYSDGRANPKWKLELWQAAKSLDIDLPATPDRFEFGGDAKRGKKLVFEHAAAQCIRCHKIGDKSAVAPFGIGPELTKIGDSLNRTQLVSAMLEPAKDIADGYGTILLETKAGEQISGVLANRTETEWTINLADGTTRAVAPADIETHTLTSVMPPVAALMAPEEIRDVVSYLATLK